MKIEIHDIITCVMRRPFISNSVECRSHVTCIIYWGDVDVNVMFCLKGKSLSKKNLGHKPRSNAPHSEKINI